MLSLDKKLQRWMDAKLISPEQVRAIRGFESQTSRPSWILYGAVAIGVAAVVIGLISIGAANWDRIPASIKLINYLIVQTGLGFFLFKQFAKTGILREALLAFFALFFLAGIGLTAQIFHIVSDGWSGILFWCALSLACVLQAQSRFIVYIWTIMLLLAQGIWTLTVKDATSGFFSEVSIFRYDVTSAFFTSVCLFAYLGLGLFTYGRLQLPYLFREALVSLSLVIILIAGSLIGTFFWYLGATAILSGRSFILPSYLDQASIMRLHYAPWLGSLVVALALYLRRPLLSKKLNLTLLLLCFGVSALVSAPVLLNLEANRILCAILSIGVWWIAALAAVYAGYKKLFDVLTIVIIVRLMVIYFEVFDSMLTTGIGLVLSGILVLLVAWLWFKFRHRLVSWIEAA